MHVILAADKKAKPMSPRIGVHLLYRTCVIAKRFRIISSVKAHFGALYSLSELSIELIPLAFVCHDVGIGIIGYKLSPPDSTHQRPHCNEPAQGAKVTVDCR